MNKFLESFSSNYFCSPHTTQTNQLKKQPAHLAAKFTNYIFDLHSTLYIQARSVSNSLQSCSFTQFSSTTSVFVVRKVFLANSTSFCSACFNTLNLMASHVASTNSTATLSNLDLIVCINEEIFRLHLVGINKNENFQIRCTVTSCRDVDLVFLLVVNFQLINILALTLCAHQSVTPIGAIFRKKINVG